MFKTIAMARGALALLLATTFVGAAEAQTPPPGTSRAAYFTGGLFTLSGDTARFAVTLDDNNSEPILLVLMRIIDQAGNVVQTKGVRLGPGQSATLEHSGWGLYRVQAETFEFSSPINFSDRRTVVASVQFGFGLAEGFRPIGPPIWIPIVNVQPH